MNFRDKFKSSLEKLKLKAWVAKTRSHFFESPQGFGNKFKQKLEHFPPLSVVLMSVYRYRLAIFCLIAFLSADALMLGLSNYLTPKEPPARRVRERVVTMQARLNPKSSYGSIIPKNIFCPGCPIPELEIKRIEKPKDCNIAQPARGSIKLIGTIVLSDPQHSVATLNTGSDSIAVQRGDKVPNLGEVFEIRQGRVCFMDNAENIVFVDLPKEDVKFGTPIAPEASLAKTSNAAALPKVDGIDQVNENEFNISRNTLLEKLADPNLLFQAHAVPHRGQDGSIEGFKVLSIQPGSVYESLGIRVGDVIKGVDNEPLDSISKAQELYSTMRTASEMSINIDRSGSAVEQKYSIK